MIDFKYFEIDSYDSFVSDVREAFNIHKDEILSVKKTEYGARNVVLSLYPQLNKLTEKYSFLGPVAALLESQPNTSTPIHTDGLRRPVVINVSVSEPNPDNMTKFYDPEDLIEKTLPNGGPGVLHFTKKHDNVQPIAQYSLLDNPIIVHTMTPHEINNVKNYIRRTLSFGLAIEEYSQLGIEKIVEKIQNKSKQ